MKTRARGKSDETETSSSSNQVITTNLAHLSKAECNDAINDMSTKLYHLCVTLKSLTKENAKMSFRINIMPSMPMNVMSTQNMNAKSSNMLFAPNPYYTAFSMP